MHRRSYIWYSKLKYFISFILVYIVYQQGGKFEKKDFINGKTRAWLHGSCDSSDAVSSLGEFQQSIAGHALYRSIREKGTEASAVTPGA